ncbi:hypothetical protein TPY_3189 [Sulfobacillus acidophilus TPY]|nr:hypothetical protein TPY_3189 [Sulfobacillus acidophilus TPY]
MQSDPFNPDMPVPNGCTMNQQVNQDWYVFGCSNGAIGAVFTQPDYSGGVMVIGSGPDTQIIDHILANVHLYNADIGLGG